MDESPIAIRVADDLELVGALAMPRPLTGGLVLCHPHPLYGGDMDNPVITRAAEVARPMGVATLRFNFRGVGGSGGAYAEGRGEVIDATAALRVLQARLGAEKPLGLLGYSFGAWVSARAARDLPGLGALALIAPPLAMWPMDGLESADDQEILLAAGTEDAYCPAEALRRLGAGIPRADLALVEGANHFFFGKLYPLGSAVEAWVRRWRMA